MTKAPEENAISRRQLLSLGARGALAAGALAGGGVAGNRLLRPTAAGAAQAAPQPVLAAAVPLPQLNRRLITTDGFVSFPGRRLSEENGVYMFGFVEAEPGEVELPVEDIIDKYKGKVVSPAPTLDLPPEHDIFVIVTNVGLASRPDLDDAHSLHWHGFRNATSIYDGVPEVSISVPPNRSFPYFFRPHDEGTYMYHCHFEDTEHVQMGMQGNLFVKSHQDGTPMGGFTQFAYDDGDGSTGFDRQFALLLNEIDTTPHDGLLAVQEFRWTDYKPNYWTINGRSFPDSISPDGIDQGPGEDLEFQPMSSLMQANGGDRVLMRVANLGFEGHVMEMPGVTMHVVGSSASHLAGESYDTSRLEIGPGESLDVLITAPAYDAGAPNHVLGVTEDANELADPNGNYNRYLLRNRSAHRNRNADLPGSGGMQTELRVYASPLDPQSGLTNATIGAF